MVLFGKESQTWFGHNIVYLLTHGISGLAQQDNCRAVSGSTSRAELAYLSSATRAFITFVVTPR